MPTFRLFKNQTKVAEVIGADAAPLEAAILQFVGEEEKEVSIDGHVCGKADSWWQIP